MRRRPSFIAFLLLGGAVGLALSDRLRADEASDIAAPPLELPATTVTPANQRQDLVETAPAEAPLGAKESLDRAMFLFQGDDFPAALKILDSAVARFPTYPDIWQRRGYVKYNLRDQEGAIADYDRAITLRPNFGLVYFNRGLAELALDDDEKAIADFGTAIAVYGRQPAFFVFRARAEAAIGLNDEAAADLDVVVRMSPRAEMGYGARAGFRYRRGNRKGALDDYAAAVKYSFHRGCWMRGLANLQARTGDVTAALATFASSLAFDAKNADTYLDRGSLQLSEHHPEAAEADFTAALALRPHDSRAHFLLAQALHAAGDEPDAVAEFGAAAGNRANALLLERRGLARLALKDLDGAADDFRQATEVQPSFAGAWVDQASLADRRGDLAGAIDALSHALEAVGHPAVVLTIPAEERSALPTDAVGGPSETLPDFLGEDATPAKPGAAWLYLLRATEEARVGRKAEALQDAHASVYLEPGDANQKLLARVEAMKAP